ncbi:MAG: hypothetical protein ACE5IJ_00175 [Thermoplasmata archaeon]
MKFHKVIVALTLVFAVFATIALAAIGTVMSAYAVTAGKPLALELVYTSFFLWIIIPFLVLKLVQKIKER